MADLANAASLAPFGLTWGMSLSSVRDRLGGLNPAAATEDTLAFPLIELTDRIVAQGGFCPKAFLPDPGRNGDEIAFLFSGDQLGEIYLRFGYGFDRIGQDPDKLSDHAMSSQARAEFHKLIFELAMKYGAPAFLFETNGRSGSIHVQGSALFDSRENGLMHVMFGHDGGSALMGEVRYRARQPGLVGF